MLRLSISYWDLIKFPYFTDTTKRGVRGWKEAQRQGDFTDISNIKYNVLFTLPSLWFAVCITRDEQVRVERGYYTVISYQGFFEKDILNTTWVANYHFGHKLYSFFKCWIFMQFFFTGIFFSGKKLETSFEIFWGYILYLKWNRQN